MVTLRALLLIAFWTVQGEDGKLPSYIKPCRYDAADFGACVRAQLVAALPRFAKGVPELRAAPLDPARLADVAVDGRGLRLALRNASMHGLGAARVEDLKVNLKEESFSLKFVANMSLTGQYRIDGRILILPIRGAGDCAIVASDAVHQFANQNWRQLMDELAPPVIQQIVRTCVRAINRFFGSVPVQQLVVGYTPPRQ